MEVTTNETPAKPIIVKGKNGGARPGAGRPRTRPIGEPKARANEPFILPKIPFRRGVNRFEDFVTWWHALTSDQLEKLIVYVYRQWPVCDAKLADPDADNNIEKMTGPCPFTTENWRMDILTRYQSGSYCFYVKEGAIQRWTIYAPDIVDLVNYPPLIDYKTLMLSAPANKDFVRWARQRGLIANSEENGGNDGMANAAIDRLVDQNDRLVTRVVDMSERAGVVPDVDTSAQLAGMEMIQRAGERALEVAMKSADRLAEVSSRSNDPLALVKEFTAMNATLNSGGNKGNDMMIEMMRSDRDAANRREDALRVELAEQRKMMFDLIIDRKRSREDDEEEAPKGVLGMLAQFKILKEGLADLNGGGVSSGENSAETAAAKEKKDTMLELLLRNAPVIMGGLDSMLGKALTVFMAAKMGTAPGQPQANGQPQPNPTQTTLNTPPAAPTTPLTPFLTAITPALLHHMSTDGLGGDTFANWLISAGPITTWPQPGMNGRGVYDFLKESGKDVILQVLQTHPPIWDTAGKTPKKLDEFIEALLKADDMLDEEEGGTGEGGGSN